MPDQVLIFRSRGDAEEIWKTLAKVYFLPPDMLKWVRQFLNHRARRGARVMGFFTASRKPGPLGQGQPSYGGGLKRRIFGALCILGLLIPLILATPRKAEAACFCCCSQMARSIMDSVRQEINTQHDSTVKHISDEFVQHERWLVETYLQAYWGKAMMMMTEQMTTVSMYQMQILGSFLDAKHQIETQRLFSELSAQAMKDYTPSDSLCTIGSAARSMGQADFNGTLTRNLMQKWSRNRQLLNANSNASEGKKEDREGRLAQFLLNYCDVNDDNLGLATICNAAVTQERKNKDVDYGYTISQPWTLNINFGDTTITNDEEDVLALAANLYSHDVFDYFGKTLLQDSPVNQQLYLDLRSIVAKRSIAEQSFQAIAAMKASGTSAAAGTADYLRAVMRQLGIASDAEVDALIGENPSYYAQMEILTKKLFQTPDFFVDLYEKPANAARKGAALEALNLIQENDIFNSALRSEQMMGVLLELRLETVQNDVQNKATRMAQ